MINKFVLNKHQIKTYNTIRSKEKRKLFCHAPFSTLLFTEYGEMIPCYYNKNIVFGRYPKDNPFNIWFGKEMNELREHIKKNDLSYGCQDCYNYIASENYYSTGAWKYDYLPVNKSNYPISLDFQISNICNLACIMCNGEYSQTVRQMREKKDKYLNPYDEAFVEKIKPFLPYLKEAAFTGGEVFLIKIYYDIWDAMAEINPEIRISITTNGTILNSKVKEYLEKLKFNITISLDSVHKDNFEQIRRFSNFNKYLENFEYFQQYTQKKNTFFTVKICPMRQNWHEIPDIIRFLNKKDVLFQFNNVVFPSYVALWNLSSTELNKIVQFLKGQKFETNTPTQNTNIERVKNLILQLQNWEQEAKEFEKAYPDINKKDSKELSIMLLQSIHEYFNKNPHIPIVNYHSITYESMFQELMQKIDDEVVLKNAFLYYFRMPVNRFVSEFNIRDMEKIIERTIQVGQPVPPEIM
ncbi:MAG: radical SAM protein [Bacteroidales bacterium]|nr:radical SAM protein [Bacteroidales bacterium]